MVWQSEQNQSEDNVLLQEPHITLSLAADNWGEDGGEGKKFMMAMLNEWIKESKERRRRRSRERKVINDRAVRQNGKYLYNKALLQGNLIYSVVVVKIQFKFMHRHLFVIISRLKCSFEILEYGIIV